jgi:hypothetical protein
MPGLSLTAHTVRKDLLENPCQSNHADNIGCSNAADIAAEDRLKDIGDQVQARWRCEFGIPSGEVVVAVSLCLRDVENFVLGEGKNEMRNSSYLRFRGGHTRYGSGTVCSTERAHQESGMPSRM